MDALIAILSKPDNIPIAALLPLTLVLVSLWWRVARRNDALKEAGGIEAVARDMAGPAPPPEEREPAHADEGVLHTWPYLVRVELLALLVVMLVLIVWSIVLDAPLEQMANAMRTPNPSKAPWYFLGLQEMLVYFDPWIAGVALPTLIIAGLCAIPYVDINPAGSGYHSWAERRFAISTFMFGFLFLWLLLIFVGVFCRGPGWNWFWPWEPWDASNMVEAPTRNWPAVFGIGPGLGASWFGGLTVLGYYGTAVAYWYAKRRTDALRRLGAVRYGIVAFLLLTMVGLVVKMALRLAFAVKYVWVTDLFRI